jgi:hypothetical protein
LGAAPWGERNLSQSKAGATDDQRLGVIFMIGEENVEENMVEYLDDQVDPAGPGSIESLCP